MRWLDGITDVMDMSLSRLQVLVIDREARRVAAHGVSEPDILECEVKWALGSITMNKASRGDGIPVELFQILKHDAVKVLHSICQQICCLACLPRSKCVLISWLQSPSTVIFEPKVIKSVTVSIVCPSICHEMIGPDNMILVFEC